MKWRVGIFGTEHDQKFLNKIIESQIDDNVELVHYLKPKEFGLNTDVHTHESCIKSASSCDIAFFFINKRYGGLYQGRKFWVEHPDDWTFGLSITHVEYRKVKMNKIPTIVFVHSRTWEEIKNVFLEGNKGKISDKERYDSVRNRWTKNKYYVRNPEIYCFIREASVGIGKKHLYQSWVSVYDDFDLKNNCSNLKEKILERLISLTPDILKELINKQYINIRQVTI